MDTTMNEIERNKLWNEYAKKHSVEVREQLIIEYAPLVKLVAGRLNMYLGNNVEYDDLVGYGVFGLIDAIDEFYNLTIKYTTETVDQTEVTKATQINVAGEGQDPIYVNEGTNISLTGTNGGDSSKATFYVVVWLEEIGDEQQDVDASKENAAKSYQGTITFDAVDALGNKSGVTATFLS